MSRSSQCFTGLVLLMLSALVTARASVPAEAYARINTALVQAHVLPRYERLAEATSALAAAAEDYCAQPDDAGLNTVRIHYHAAADAWMGVQHLRFGPVELFMRAYRLYFWPQAQGKVANAVRELAESPLGGEPLVERFRTGEIAAQGLPALEYLLYRKDTGGSAQAPPCALLRAITANLRSMAAGIVADWRGGDIAFARTMAAPGPDNLYFRTHREATLELFKGLHGGLQLVADIKLMPVLGETAGNAQPRLAESRLSARALRNILLNLEAQQALYLGESGPGLTDLVQAHGGDPKLDPLMRKAYRMTIATARSIDPPLGEAVTSAESRPAVEKLLTQVLALKQIVRTRLATALDLTMGFNALDGD